jgi:hypothetical protein
MIGFLSFFGGVPLKGPIHIIGVERTFCFVWEKKKRYLAGNSKKKTAAPTRGSGSEPNPNI